MMDAADVEYAGFWVRVGAALIDTILVLIVTWPPLVAIYGWAYFGDGHRFIAGPWDFLISWICPAVASILFWVSKQATPGKMMLAVRVVDVDTGATLTVPQSIGRYLAYFLSMLPLFAGIIWVAFDARKQGFHDKLAGTVVIRAKRRGPQPVRFLKSETS